MNSSNCDRPRRSRAVARALFAGALLAATAQAEEADELIESVNAYRTASHECQGQRMEAVGPLAPDARLSRVEAPSGGGRLTDELRQAGYSAAYAQYVVITGPQTARAAMDVLARNYCKVLASRRFADIGVSHEDATWRIVLARPLLSSDLGDWSVAGKAVLEHVNAARAKPRTCGNRRFEAAAPLEWDAALAEAALQHSRDMASRNYFAHRGRGGTQVGERAKQRGYAWRHIGENIAAGQGSAQQVVAGWLASPHHCANIMDPAFTEMAAAYAVNRKSQATIYWTQVLGTPLE
jgi:Cysteine-rich secretory protein family